MLLAISLVLRKRIAELPNCRTAELRVLGFALCVLLVGAIVACGGGSSAPKPPTPSGTPAGTYTIVVNATSGSATHSQNLTLVVQ